MWNEESVRANITGCTAFRARRTHSYQHPSERQAYGHRTLARKRDVDINPENLAKRFQQIKLNLLYDYLNSP